ncbi:MAG: hypothetical protein R3E97_08835 [Candidatus Eisenbacteria bacterium]
MRQWTRTSSTIWIRHWSLQQRVDPNCFGPELSNSYFNIFHTGSIRGTVVSDDEPKLSNDWFMID